MVCWKIHENPPICRGFSHEENSRYFGIFQPQLMTPEGPRWLAFATSWAPDEKPIFLAPEGERPAAGAACAAPAETLALGGLGGLTINGD